MNNKYPDILKSKTLIEDLIKLANPLNSTVKFTEADKNNFYWSSSWRKLQAEVLKRDNKECQVSKALGLVEKDNLLAHHILPIEYYPEYRLEAWNIITVNKVIHNKIHKLIAYNKWAEDEWY